MPIERAGRNENEPHQMSVERGSTSKPSHYPNGEGSKEASGQQPWTAQPIGGVSVDGMSGSDAGLSQEISTGARESGQPFAQAGETGEAKRAGREVGVSRSSDEPADSTTAREPRGGTCAQTYQSDKGQGDGWEDLLSEWTQIRTPEKVRKLQRTLYRKAKAEPKYRFYSLYGELSRKDILETALRMVVRNGGCAGVDGVGIEQITKDEESEQRWLEEVGRELKGKTYKPAAVLRHYIPKGDGTFRPLGIPTVKDRVVQAAVVIVLMPIFEADMHEQSYAYRPKRNAHQAIAAIAQAVTSGRREVIDADLSGYFDSIPHGRMMRLVARRVSDGAMLKLIRSWLRAPVEERGKDGDPPRRRGNTQGTPQGGVISPLLANLYLDRLDKGVNDQCKGQPRMVRYADDFVILCYPGQGKGLLERLHRWLNANALKLNEQKTRLVDMRAEGIKFLGFQLSLRQWRSRVGSRYVHIEPHWKSQQKLRDKIKEKLNHWTMHREAGEVVGEINRMLKGWAGYFRYGYPSHVFGKMQFYLNGKLWRWLWRKHNRQSRKLGTVTTHTLHQRYGLMKLA
jgi:group II intron reverse transcriptase/maturase